MLDKDSFVMYAMKAYDNHSCCTLDEFNQDVKKFSLLKRLISKENFEEEYVLGTLNLIVSIRNVFLYPHSTHMMFFKVKKKDWGKLKTYLIFLNAMPDEILELRLINSEIELCQDIVKILRKV